VEKILTNNAKGLGPCLKWLSACQQADKRLWVQILVLQKNSENILNLMKDMTNIEETQQTERIN
jgi:hypothetical protein